MMLLRLNIILFMVLQSHQLRIPLISSNIRFEEVRRCAASEEGSRAIVWDLKLNRISRQQVVLQGNISMTVPMDNNVAGVVTVAEKSSGGWNEQAFVFKSPYFCQDMMLAIRSGWTTLWEKSGISPPITCPIPKGNYNMKNYPSTELTKHLFGRVKQGTFKAKLEFFNKSNTRLGCFEFVVGVSTSSR